MNRTPRPKDRTEGFTFIETLVATLILVIGLLGCAGMFGYATATLYKAERESLAALLVTDKIEALRASVAANVSAEGGLTPEPEAQHSEFLASRAGHTRLVLSPDDASFLRVWRADGTATVRLQVAVYSVSPEPRESRRPLAFAATAVRRQP